MKYSRNVSVNVDRSFFFFSDCDGTNMTKLMRNINTECQLSAAQLAQSDNGKLLGGNVFALPIATKPSAPFSLLVESLVQQLCQLMDPTNAKQRYTNICAQLHRMNLIDETYRMNELDVMRSEYQRALYQLATVARDQTDLPVALQSVWPVADTNERSWSRYHREFDELNFIAGGGFGRVYRARHRLDGVDYAVKKVTIKYTNIERVMSHLGEVKTFASLNHTNIVPYKAAWLEPFFNNPNERQHKPMDASTTTNQTRSHLSSYHEESSIDEEDDDDVDDDDDGDVDDDDVDDDGHNDNDSLFDQLSSNRYGGVDDSWGSDFIEFERSTGQKMPHGGDTTVSSSPKADQRNMMCEYNINQGKTKVSARHVQVDLSSSNSNVLNSNMDFNVSQPHLKLKWATLYIQMALRPLTLRKWLDERNKCTDDFDTFYKKYLRQFVQNEHPDAVSGDNEHDGVGRHSGDNRCSLSALAFDHCMSHEWHNDEVAMDIFMQMLQGLNYIHLQNIVHHDIKPSNIFIGWERNGKLYVQLGDFGLACPLQANHSRGDGLGTPAYAAPEQLSGQCHPKVSHTQMKQTKESRPISIFISIHLQSDLFSLGIILLELLIPFKTNMERAKTIQNAREGILPDDLPKRYFKLLHR